jgi:Tfp pilus assembly PilM family ATPase/Tfp pilus assembly protein PilN
MRKKGDQDKKRAGKQRKEVLLIEIGNDWIKLVQAERGRGKVTLSKVYLEPIDENTDISGCIATALKQGKFSDLPALVCLPRQAVNVRLLELPSVDDAEIADMVDLQVGRQTPYSRDEILADYKTVGLTRKGSYTRVMLAIVQRSIVRERFYEIESAGIEIDRMGVSSEGVLSWFLKKMAAEESRGARVLLDVDSFYTYLLVVNGGKVIFTKSILVGSDQLLDDAEKSRERLVREINSAMQSCRADVHDLEFESLTISGAGVHIDGLESNLSSALNLNCEKVDCLADVKFGKGAADLGDRRYETVSMTGLVGLALDPAALEFDLIPDVVKARRLLMSTAKSASLFASMVVAAMVSLSMAAMVSYGLKVDRLKHLNAEIAKVKGPAEDVQRKIEVIREANRRQDSRFSMMNILPAVHMAMPDNVYIENMTVDAVAGKVSLGGTASTFQDIQKLIKQLDESPLFDGISEEGSATRDDKQRYKFKVVAKFEEAK